MGQTVKNLPAMQKTQVPFLGQKIWRREWQPTAVFLLGEFHGQRSQKAIVHGVSKSIEKDRGMPKCGTGIIVNVLPAVVGRTCLRVIILN